MVLDVMKELRGGIIAPMKEVASHGQETVRFLIKDEVLYPVGDIHVPCRPDTDVEKCKVNSGSVPKIADPKKDKNDTGETDQTEDDIEDGGGEETSEISLEALEMDFL